MQTASNIEVIQNNTDGSVSIKKETKLQNLVKKIKTARKDLMPNETLEDLNLQMIHCIQSEEYEKCIEIQKKIDRIQKSI